MHTQSSCVTGRQVILGRHPRTHTQRHDLHAHAQSDRKKKTQTHVCACKCTVSVTCIAKTGNETHTLKWDEPAGGLWWCKCKLRHKSFCPCGKLQIQTKTTCFIWVKHWFCTGRNWPLNKTLLRLTLAPPLTSLLCNVTDSGTASRSKLQKN